MKVPPEDIHSFRKRYEQQILLEAESIAELLVLFSAKMEELRLKQQHSVK
jgi:hypothetical protein